MRGRKLLAIAGTITALSLGVTACGDDDEGDTGGGGEDVSAASFDLKVGGLIPLTGDLAIFGPAGQKAAELAIEESSAALEEAGTDITATLEVSDTETKPQAGQQAATELISGGASCLAGDWSSDNTIPIGQTIAARQQVPLISPASTSPAITDLPDDGYVFRTAPSDALQGQVLADAVAEEFGADATISVAARNDAYGEGIATVFSETFNEGGGNASEPLLYDPEASTYDSEAADIVADSPDGYVIIDFEDPYGKVGAALVRTGDFDATTMWTADGLAFEPKIPSTIPADALDGASGSRPATTEDSAAAEEFDKLFTASKLEPKDRNTFDAQNFDAVSLCVLAAVAAGSAEGPDIQAKIQEVASAPGEQYDFTTMADAITALQAGEDIDFEGTSGPLDLDDNGDPINANYEVYEYVNGALEVQETVEKSAEPTE